MRWPKPAAPLTDEEQTWADGVLRASGRPHRAAAA